MTPDRERERERSTIDDDDDDTRRSSGGDDNRFHQSIQTDKSSIDERKRGREREKKRGGRAKRRGENNCKLSQGCSDTHANKQGRFCPIQIKMNKKTR